MRKLVRKQFLPITLNEAWDFFSSPHNLNAITPEGLSFKIHSDPAQVMYPGMFIVYTLKPMFNIPVQWVTEITHVRDKEYFVDEQRMGPYAIWHHEHHFEATDKGVWMTDTLHYHIGKSVFGWLAGQLFVHKKVAEIFDYRYQVLETYFKK